MMHYTHNKFVIMSIVLFAALFLLGCTGQTTTAVTSSSTPNNEVQNTENIIAIRDFAFTPAELIVDAGTTVIWNHDDAAAHTVVAEGLFESAVLNRGGQFSFTFDQPGTYIYRCSIHPAMKGTIIVR